MGFLPKMKKKVLKEITKEPKKNKQNLMDERYHFNIPRVGMNGDRPELAIHDLNLSDLHSQIDIYLKDNGGVKRSHLNKDGSIIASEERRYKGVINKEEMEKFRKQYAEEIGVKYVPFEELLKEQEVEGTDEDI